MSNQYVPEGDGERVEAPVDDSVTTDGVTTDDTAAQQVPSLEQLVAERTADLQRLQAEYVNYKRRVDRDRDLARQRGVEAVIADLLPTLDGIAGARAHDELSGGAKMIADEIEKVTTKYGLVAYGQVGDPFDPQIHEALMHVEAPGYDVTACAQIIQQGYRLGDRVIRPARVAVAEPTEPGPDSVPNDASDLTDPTD